MTASRAYRTVLWISEKGLKDLADLQERYAKFMRGILAKIEPERLSYDVALTDQWEELVELELLKQTIAVRDFAEETGGLNETHGPALETAANALYEHCGWEDEDITNWFAGLVLGAGVSLEWEDKEE